MVRSAISHGRVQGCRVAKKVAIPSSSTPNTPVTTAWKSCDAQPSAAFTGATGIVRFHESRGSAPRIERSIGGPGRSQFA